jgi:hypothetical protein
MQKQTNKKKEFRHIRVRGWGMGQVGCAFKVMLS